MYKYSTICRDLKTRIFEEIHGEEKIGCVESRKKFHGSILRSHETG